MFSICKKKCKYAIVIFEKYNMDCVKRKFELWQLKEKHQVCEKKQSV